MLRLNRQQHILNELRTDITRRWFFKECGVGLGTMALHQLLGGNALAGSTAPAGPLVPKSPHFSPRAKSVIYLFMAGGPSQLELFDHKPELAKWGGKLPPPGLLQAIAPRSSPPAQRCSSPSSPSVSMAPPVQRYRSYFPTWPEWLTTSPS